MLARTMAAGSSTPLHLAASLLALFAAAGIAAVAALSPQRARLSSRAGSWLVAGGAVTYAAGHALNGALVAEAADAIGWLRAAGLVAIAAGRLPVPARRAMPSSVPRMAAVLPLGLVVPVAPARAALVGAIGGVVAALRAATAGRRGMLIAGGLLLWAAAEVVATLNATAAAGISVTGSIAIGAWLWQLGADRLLAKVVLASLLSLLALALLLAGVISRLGARELVDEELERLAGGSEQLATEISKEWPRDAINDAAALKTSDSVLPFHPELNPDGFAPEEAAAQAQRAYDVLLSDEDFFIILDPTGRPLLSHAPDPQLLGGSFVLSATGSEVVQALADGAEEAARVLTIGGRVVSLGGIRLRPSARFRAEDPPRGYLITGRVADDVWAADEADDLLGADVAVAVEGQVSAASPRLRAASEDGIDRAAAVAAALVSADRLPVTVGEATLYAAADDIVDITDGTVLGRVLTVSDSGLLADLEQREARRLFVLTLVAAALATLVAAALARRLVAPIRRLTEVAATVGAGDLTARADVQTADEVGELGRTFDTMTSNLAAQAGQLRESASQQSRLRARLEALTASMSDALVAVDADGRVITFNPAAERLVGRSVDDVLDLPLAEVLRGRGPGDVVPAVALGDPDSEQALSAQVLLQGPGGRYIPIAATAAPVRDSDGHVLGRVFVLRDVTREAELERMKAEFLSNVSHELRTPLTPIKGYADILARRALDPNATQRYATQILESTARLERIVAMIVEFAALDSGKLRPERCPTNLSQLVGDVLAEHRRRFPDREFTRRVPRSLPPALVDPTLLRRCLDELLDNAVKFSPGGEPVSVSALLEQGDHGPVLRLSVRDRGVGIESDAATRVFSDFYQADASETRHYGGLGLGLALVRRIVDGLDGDVVVESQPGRGSTFHLLLPTADEE